MTAVLSSLLSIASLCWAMATHPARLRCPPPFYAEGVRPSGRTTCVYDPTPETEANDCATGRCDGSGLPTLRVEARIYCTGGARPIASLDGRTVGCQRP